MAPKILGWILVAILGSLSGFVAAPAHAAPVRRFDSPLANWQKIDDAGFGDHALNGGHLGIDLLAHPWTPVFAAADGRVVRSEIATMAFKNSMGKPDVPAGHGRYFGTNIVLDHGGIYTLYGHLSAIAVKAGEPVCRGQLIGFSGNTGRSSGPHLHFAIANSDQMWGYADADFSARDSYTYGRVTYYNPQVLVRLSEQRNDMRPDAESHSPWTVISSLRNLLRSLVAAGWPGTLIDGSVGRGGAAR